MKSHEVLREVFDQSNPKVIAEELGVSVSMIYKWAEPVTEGGSGAANPLDRVAALMRCTHDHRIVKWLAEHNGGYYVENPKLDGAHPFTVVPATNRIVQEFADMLSAIAAAAVDNNITSDESEKIRARWEDLKSETEQFVNCCEKGNFRLITEKSK